jgi:hypothetical protein
MHMCAYTRVFRDVLVNFTKIVRKTYPQGQDIHIYSQSERKTDLNKICMHVLVHKISINFKLHIKM